MPPQEAHDTLNAVNVRPPRPDDAEALFELVAAGDLAEIGFVDYELADAVEELTQPGRDPERDAWAVWQDSRLTGYASVCCRPGTELVDVELTVAPDAGDEVFAELLGRIRQRTSAHAVQNSYPAALASAYAPALPSSRAAARLTTDGWQPVRRFSRMRIDIDASTAAPLLPPSVTLRHGLDADEEIVHTVISDSFAGHFGFVPESFDEWRNRQRARAGYDRELWLLAEVAGEPAAALIGRHMAEQGWVGALGVRTTFRRQGLGAFLLRTAFAGFAARGYQRVELGVDTDGTTGAYRLYESAGMQTGVAHDCYQIEIPSGLPA